MLLASHPTRRAFQRMWHLRALDTYIGIDLHVRTRQEGRDEKEGKGERERGRIRRNEAEASLLGDYGSLIPIQRSELHAKRKSHPKWYHAENVWSCSLSLSLSCSLYLLYVLLIMLLVEKHRNFCFECKVPLSVVWFASNAVKYRRISYVSIPYLIVWIKR